MATLRAMTDIERNAFAKSLNLQKSLSPSPLVELLLVLPGAFFACLVPSVVWIVALRLFGMLEQVSDWTEVSTAYWGIVLIYTTFCIFFAVGLIKSWKVTTRRIADLEADLAAGTVIADQMTVMAAKGATEQEHLARLYFLLGEDGRVFTIYDYDSADMEGRGKSRTTSLRFARELSILKFPTNGEIHYEFSGQPIRKPRAVAMYANPKDWPEPEEFWNIPWEDIDTRLKLAPSSSSSKLKEKADQTGR
jgi:hypothetical protein